MNQVIVIALVGAVAVTAAIGINLTMWKDEAEPVAAKPAPGPATPPASLSTPTPARPSDAPVFDVVRINPKGDTVIAGRALPHSNVTVLDGGNPIGKAIADGRGEWVFVPTQPLPSGSRQLALEMQTADGRTVPSDSVVVLVVPERDRDIAGQPAKGNAQALALRVPREGAGGSTVLQKPSADAAKGLIIDTVDYDDRGGLSISGRASPRARVQLYLDNRHVGRTEAGPDGRWRVTPGDPVAPGNYRLRADELGPQGKVAARVEMPFARAEPLKELQPGTFVVVQPGNSLWRLARSAYGRGTQYTVIFEANQEQIRDPDMIYPGQVFQIPVTN